MSAIDDLMNALAGRGYIDGSTWLQRPQNGPDGPPAPTQSAPQATPNTISPQQAQQELAMGRQNMQPQQAPQQYAGFSPMGQQPGMQTGAFVPPQQSQMIGRMIPPDQAGYSAPMIQRPIHGSAPVVAQGFSRLPSLLDMLLNRRA